LKNIFKTLLITGLFIISCTQNDDGNVISETIEEDENTITATEACVLSDFFIQQNSTIIIDCLLDLEGETINVPSGVTFVFEGGDVFNGTLIFSEDGQIAGELLNSSLTVEGDVSMIGDEFQFYPERWDIIEGEVSSTIAESNKLKLNELLLFIDDLNALDVTTFNIGAFDAFFKVDGFDEVNNIELTSLGIRIPSDFNLILSDDTYIRVYPNENVRPTLVYIGDGVENITITGGHFVGDRDEHDYNAINSTHEWGHLLRIAGANNITITQAEFIDATGDGIDVHSKGHSFDQNHIFTTDIHINGNRFVRNRRNQISITSGSEIFVENNEFIDASIHTDLSRGVAPGFAIDVEAFRQDGIEFEIAEDIYIRNNVESGSRIGAFTVHTGDRVVIEDNNVQSHISYSTSIETIIRNNVITAITESNQNNGTAIVAGRTDRYEANYGNLVYGNRVVDFSTGIVVTNVDIEVYDNIITNTGRGIVLEQLKDAELYDNTITSNRSGSVGYSSGAASTFIDNVIITQTNIEENLVNVQSDPFKFVTINQNAGFEDYRFTITGNNVSSPNTSTFTSKGVDFINNTILEGGVRISSAYGINILNNNITTTHDAIRIDSGCENIQVTGNVLIANGLCINENNTDAVNVVIVDNTCID